MKQVVVPKEVHCIEEEHLHEQQAATLKDARLSGAALCFSFLRSFVRALCAAQFSARV